jgi:hypothetical protein
MLALISAAVTLANLLLSLVVGIRLFRLARRGSSFGPECWLASFFVFGAFLGAGLNISVYVGMADPSLALSPLHGSLVLASSTFIYCVGTLGIYVFNWITFRPDSKRARNAVIAGTAFVFGSALAQAMTEGFKVTVFPGAAYWSFYIGRVAPYYWLAVESLLYWSAARRRMRIGLADPLVTNRFFLLGLWAVAWAAMGFSDIVARGIYMWVSGSTTATTEVHIDTAGPIILATICVTSVLGLLAAVTLALSFFPNRAYRRFIEARAAASRL